MEARDAIQLGRFGLAAALVGATLILPSLGRLFARKRLARLAILSLLSGAVVLVARFLRHAIAGDWISPFARLELSMVMLWAPISLALLGEMRQRPPRRSMLLFTSVVAVIPLLGEAVFRSSAASHRGALGIVELLPDPGPLFLPLVLYLLIIGPFLIASFWRDTAPAGRPERRRLALLLAIIVVTLANDALLYIGVLPSAQLVEVGILMAALVLVDLLHRNASAVYEQMETRLDEATRDAVEARDDLGYALANVEAVIAAQPDAVLLHRDGVTTFMNPAGRRWLGLEGEGVGIPIKMLLAEVLEPSSRFGSRPVSDEPGAAYEERFRHIDGRTLLGEVVERTIDYDGQPTVMSIVRDLGERRGLERQLMSADRLASLGTLAAGVAHEINNPLTYVMTNLALLRESLSRDALASEMLADVEEGALRVARIVEGLGAFSRRRQYHEGRVDVARAVDAALKLVQNELRHRAEVVVEVPRDLPMAIGDEAELVQVLVNLLVNAAHALDEVADRAHEIRISATAAGETLVLIVSDTGCGIPEAIRHRIMEPFFTTKALGRGTGLGLSICHGIIQGLGGRLVVDSQPGDGTQIAIHLPVQEDAPRSTTEVMSRRRGATPAPPAEDIGADAARTGGGLKILVVDDEHLVTRSVRRLLRNHDVTTASSGAECLRHCETDSYDVVLCDVMMPGMSGTEVVTRLARTDPSLASRVVFMTGGVFTPDEKERLVRLGNRVLRKPLSTAQLEEVLSTVARRAS